MARVVHFEASEGQEAFSEWLKTNPGAEFLGEIGLVGDEFLIQNTGIYFDFPLFDENAASHIALGKGFQSAFMNAETTSGRQFDSYGCNRSQVHTDIMFGSPKVSIVATKTTRGEVVLLDSGRWSF